MKNLLQKQKEVPKLSIMTRNRALIDAFEESASDEESSVDEENALMLVEEVMDDDPYSFYEAYHHPVIEKRIGWLNAIKKELLSMKKCQVWLIVNQDEVPKGRKLVGHCWVFVQKRVGTYRTRLVALRYSQVARVNFNNHFSPVFCDTN